MGQRQPSRQFGRRAFVTAVALGASGCVSLPESDTNSESSAESSSASWTMAGQDPRNTSRLTGRGSSGIGGLSWQRSTGSEFVSPPVTSVDLVFVPTQSTLVGFDRDDGTVAFSQPLPGGLGGAPAVTDDLIVVPRDTFGEGFDQIDLKTPTVYAIDRETGQQLWEHTLSGSDLGSIAVADDIYVQSDREIRRIAMDGTDVWHHSFPQSFGWRKIHSQFRPVIGSDGVYAGHRNKLVKLDRTTGNVQWTHPTKEAEFAPVVVDEGVLIASTGDGIVGVHPDSGHVRWHVDKSSMWAPAVSETVFVVSAEGTLLGIDPVSGERRWQSEQPQSTCPPVVVGETVFTASGGALTVTDTATGQQVGSRSVDTFVTRITPGGDELFVREPKADGPVVGRYPIR